MTHAITPYLCVAGARDAIDWYREQRAWWQVVQSGAYRSYYEDLYAQRLAAV